MLSPELLAGMAVMEGPSRACSSQLFPLHFSRAPRGVIHWENAGGTAERGTIPSD